MNNLRNLIILIFAISIVLLFACKNAGNKTQEEAVIVKTDTVNYAKLGKKYIMATGGVLSENLIKAINTNGTESAIEFCNIKADMLTDSLANSLGVSIKRLSDKPRNPKNEIGESEIDYFNLCKQNIEDGEALKPKIQELENMIIGYYPIIINDMCLKCHGLIDSNITASVFEKINQLYPQDKAVGYKPNELRGIWVIEMEKVENK